MTDYVVPDSGVFLAPLLGEILKPAAERLIVQWQQAQLQLVAPALFKYEIIATIRKSVVRGRLTQDVAETGIHQILRQMISYQRTDSNFLI